ncbi:MAG: HEPN domain-containing protein [Actinobacteria bacterium]|nr:HEPN domain-containing protein [Actinomycetota bacterium]
MAKKARTRNVNKAEARAYMDKGEQFLMTMKAAVKNEDWDAAGLNAIHAVISANDALLGTRHGIRPSSPYHGDAAVLLSQYEQGEGARKNANRLDRMMRKKNLVEYEGRKLKKSEAAALATEAERFFSWVKSMLS